MGTHNSCPSKLDGGMPIEQMAMLNDSINLIAGTLALMIDGGNTEAINETIEDAEPDEALKLRNELLGESPNLSDTVMIHTTVIEEVLPAFMVKQILVSNPSAAKSDMVQQALDNRINPLPWYMREEINLGKDSLVYSEMLKADLSYYHNKREDILNRKLMQLKRDTASGDSLEMLLIGENNLKRTYQLRDYYVRKGRFTEAEDVFNQIPQNFGLSPKEIREYNLLNQFFDIQMNLKRNHLTWFDMSGEQKQIITTLSTDSTAQAGLRSRAVLSLVDNIDYGYPIPEIEEGGNKNMNPEPVVYPETFSVYPNPANDWFIIDYALGEKENVKDIGMGLYNAFGTKVASYDIRSVADQFLTECQDYPEGIYYIRKYEKDQLIDELSLVISHGNGPETNDQNGNKHTSAEGENFSPTGTMRLFPNPAKDYVIVTFDPEVLKAKHAVLQVSDMKGSVIYKQKLSGKEAQYKISTTSWPKGVYSVSLIGPGIETRNLKLVID